MLVLLAGLVALTGGGSRSDIQSLIVLRPAAVLILGYALCGLTASQLRSVRTPALLVGGFMLLTLMQLVPLPPSVWESLPNREEVARISALLGMEHLWRPLSLDPNRTWNTFFALVVPMGAVILVAIQAPDHRRFIVPVLVLTGLLSAALGFLQAIGGRGLHLYEITHEGFPVGLFANKNHQSVMLLWLMLSAAWGATLADPRRRSATAAVGGALALIVVLFPLLILTGSRAGLLLSLPLLMICFWLLYRAPAMKTILRQSGRRARLIVGGLAASLAACLLFVFSALAASDRQTALSRLFEANAAEDLRSSYLPILVRMAVEYLPFGSGFGSFEAVFDRYEPSEMLTSRYMNQAHNDLVQVVIEGGLAGLAILLVGVSWIARSCWVLWRTPGPENRSAAIFYASSLGLWLAASLVDYPLRTPLAAMLFATLAAYLALTVAQATPALSVSVDCSDRPKDAD